MKKSAFILAAMMASSGAMAATTLSEGKNIYTMQQCTLLANDITMVTSKGVVAAVACDTNTNFMAVSTCHSKGLTATRSAAVTSNAAGDTTCTVVTGGETCVQTVTGSLFPSASTKNGTVTQIFPGSACDSTNAGTIADAWASNTN